MGVSEIAERIGVSKKRADQIVKEKGFPAGRRLKMGTAWSTEDVEAWIAKHRGANVTDPPADPSSSS